MSVQLEQVPVIANHAEPVTDEASTPEIVTEDVLVEEVSIDGMCGVY
jgi:mycofactocin precursor